MEFYHLNDAEDENVLTLYDVHSILLSKKSRLENNMEVIVTLLWNIKIIIFFAQKKIRRYALRHFQCFSLGDKIMNIIFESFFLFIFLKFSTMFIYCFVIRKI